eukprot:Nk52_evm51s352 gene=Nk52_evmTU51s352
MGGEKREFAGEGADTGLERKDLEANHCKSLRLESVINEKYLTDDFQGYLRKALNGEQVEETRFTDSVTVKKEPFKVCIIENFCKEEGLDELKSKLLVQKYGTRSNDLFEFFQTSDLKNNEEPVICSFRDCFFEQCRKFMKKTTGLELNDKIDMNCSRYEKGGHLLCHDDELEGRRIAFILYLVDPEWSRQDGGCLNIFGVDKNCEPVEVVGEHLPKWNSLAFFYVCEESYHSVAEVLGDKSRLSLGGWFHGKPIKRKHRISDQPIEFEPFSGKLKENSLVNGCYSRDSVMKNIQDKFLEDSSIELKSFFDKEFIANITSELKHRSLVWEREGPANKKWFSKLNVSSLQKDSYLKTLLEFSCSEDFQNILNSMTGLSLSQLSVEIQKFDHGDYTLLYDGQHAGEGADIFLYLDCEEWGEAFGGTVRYVSDNEELMRICPDKNSLSIVFRDGETSFYTKYISHIAPSSLILLRVFTRE